jgi:hypothetical protein
MIKERNMVVLNLLAYFPELMKLANGLNIDWNRIDKLFSKKIQDRIKQGNGMPVTVEVTIYDIIVSIKKGDITAVGMMDFLNKMVRELSGRLSSDEKKLLKSNIQGVLINFDRKYLNFAGELAVLNNLLKSQKYTLKEVEVEMPNGKCIDFKLESINNNSITYVEVMNIHLDEKKVTEDEEAIHKFLKGRIEKKFAEKKDGLKKDMQFFIVPVLWGGWEDIKVYSDYFIKHPYPIQYAIEPVAHVRFTDGINYFDHRFGRVSGLFNNVNFK